VAGAWPDNTRHSYGSWMARSCFVLKPKKTGSTCTGWHQVQGACEDTDGQKTLLTLADVAGYLEPMVCCNMAVCRWCYLQ